jgi:hypothetical protein
MAKLPLIHAVPNSLVVINDHTTDYRLLGKALRLTMWDTRQIRDDLHDLANEYGFLYQDDRVGGTYTYEEILAFEDAFTDLEKLGHEDTHHTYECLASMYKLVHNGVTLMHGLTGPGIPDPLTLLSVPVTGKIVCSDLVDMTVHQLLMEITDYYDIVPADREYIQDILSEVRNVKHINAFVIDMPLIRSDERKLYLEIYENGAKK